MALLAWIEENLQLPGSYWSAPEDQVNAFRNYFQTQGRFRHSEPGEIEQQPDFWNWNLNHHTERRRGQRPQDRIELSSLEAKFLEP